MRRDLQVFALAQQHEVHPPISAADQRPQGEPNQGGPATVRHRIDAELARLKRAPASYLALFKRIYAVSYEEQRRHERSVLTPQLYAQTMMRKPGQRVPCR